MRVIKVGNDHANADKLRHKAENNVNNAETETSRDGGLDEVAAETGNDTAQVPSDKKEKGKKKGKKNQEKP